MKAAASLAKLSQAEKIGLVTGVGWMNGKCVGNTHAAGSIGFPGLCLQGMFFVFLFSFLSRLVIRDNLCSSITPTLTFPQHRRPPRRPLRQRRNRLLRRHPRRLNLGHHPRPRARPLPRRRIQSPRHPRPTRALCRSTREICNRGPELGRLWLGSLSPGRDDGGDGRGDAGEWGAGYG